MNELLHQNINIFNGHRTNQTSIEELNLHLKSGVAKKFTILHYMKEGSAFWNSITLHPIRNEDNVIQYILITCEDTTEAELNKMVYKLEHEVYEAIDHEDNLQSILNLITEKIELFYIRDVYCAIHIFNENCEVKSLGTHSLPLPIINELDILEISPNTGLNSNAVYLKDFADKDQDKALFNYWNLNHVQGSWTKPILTPQNEVSGILTLFNQDATELKQIDINYLNRLALLIQLAIKYAEQKIELSRLAFFDVETNLPNLHYFKSELSELINAGRSGMVAILHPTEFNKVVDLYGRNLGADILRQVADRMQVYFPKGDALISRFSNSLILGKVNESDCFLAYNQHLESLTQMPYKIDGEEIYITLKIGYTIFNQSMTVEQSIHQADIALSNAQKRTGTSYSIYEDNSTKQLTEEMDILNQLAYGLQHEEFEVYLQPKINFQTIEVEGFEALSRRIQANSGLFRR